MAKLCKVLAVIILISGIVNSIFLAITPYGIFNIASVLAECLTYIATFALLYGFGTLLDHARRIDQNISRLVDGQTEKKETTGTVPASTASAPAQSQEADPDKYWICPYCGYKNENLPGSTKCKICNVSRGIKKLENQRK